jgi:hypothetical protein
MSLYAKVGSESKWLAVSDLVHGRPLTTYRPGRTCTVEGCDTRLSLYNPNPRCALHDAHSY